MDSLGDFLIWTIEVFFLVLAIWIFIAVFSDIFRRTDISGVAKAGWILAIFILPFIGALIYLIARPKVTQGDLQILARADAANAAIAGVSKADELAKLQQLKDAGTISQADFDSLKARTLAA
ncbi:MAG TPA: PLDc N-terminal domain-containing protein [Dehalococcoidia bacterium]|jgi:hypothetical protein|nr:PLDc N-terminal domain-containing protein [Dehalococcoidia bacterium]